MKFTKSLFLVVFLALILVVAVQAAPPLSGAIFTTTVDGDIVNENVRYDKKEDVYLDGGPGPNAPASAAGLPEGDYYFQVTDPSGKDLLSTDHISCRMIHVNEFGVIDFVYGGTNYEYSNKDKVWEPVPCQHEQGVDIDHAELGAITVQLFPYDDTPNPGGVYKAWITPVEDYACDDSFVPDDSNKKDAVNNEGCEDLQFHGFIPAASKTDNYKVKQKGKPFDPPEITVRKFHDANFNGIWDEGEEEVTGWAVDFTDPLANNDTLYTPETVLAAEPGDYTFVEATPAGTLQTVSMLDGAVVALDPTVVVTVAGESGETHEVIYGNVGLGEVTACKGYDRNGNGVIDEGEPGVEGWKMELVTLDAFGYPVGSEFKFTDASGCVTFSDLLPGDYTIAEVFPTSGGWEATGETSYDFTVVSTLDGAVISGGSFEFTFTNICKGFADFDTKGYWHNKNGLSELTVEDQEYVNELLPYMTASDYFEFGDEPFDGYFEGGEPVAAAFSGDEEVWAAGTWQSEVSHFLTDDNSGGGGGDREQLAQQLLAFIFNVRHRLDSADAAIQMPNGDWVTAQSIIDAAIDAWDSETTDDDKVWEPILDAFNNNDAVPFIHYYPCEVIYE